MLVLSLIVQSGLLFGSNDFVDFGGEAIVCEKRVPVSLAPRLKEADCANTVASVGEEGEGEVIRNEFRKGGRWERRGAYEELGIRCSLRIDERVFILEYDPRLCAIPV